MMTIDGESPLAGDGNRLWVYVTIDDVDGDTCQYRTIMPTGYTEEDLAALEYAGKKDILRDMYPGSSVTVAPDHTELESLEAWVADGHKNVTQGPDGEYIETVVEKVQWAGKHPEEIYQIASLDFMDRFTPDEAAGIYGSGDTNVKMIISKLSAARQIDFRNQTLIDSMNYLVAISLLSQDRATEIMTR